MTANASDYNSIDELITGEVNKSIHIECSRGASREALQSVRACYQKKRCAFYLESDKGFDRDTVRSYLKFFARLAGGTISAQEAMDHFGLSDKARCAVLKLTAEQRALMNFARMSLFEPEVVFCERPLLELGPEARSLVLNWMASETTKGTVFITVGEPLREALLMPGDAWWEEEGRFFPAQIEDDSDISQGNSDETHNISGEAQEPQGKSNKTQGNYGESQGESNKAQGNSDNLKSKNAKPQGNSAAADNDSEDEVFFAGDEVRVYKVQAKSGSSTLLFDPREIDFIESSNRQNYVSVRGELYQTPSTLDELEAELTRFGFFRCHRSYIVNVQRVTKVERFTRNSFNLTLSDVAHSSIPLAKGRAEEMRATLGMK